MVFKTFFGKEEEKKKAQQQAVEAKQEGGPQNNKDAVQKVKPRVNTDEPPVAVQLENAIRENAQHDTQETRSRVYQELLFSDLLLALVDNPQLAQTAPPETLEEPQNLNVAIMSNPQGIQFAAAFTSAEAAKIWRVEGGQYVSIRGQDVFKLLEPSPADVIVVNPGSNPFVTLSKADYRSLAQGIVPQSPNGPVQSLAPGNGQNQQEQGMQISFPPDAFTDQQKVSAEKFLTTIENVEAAALGALLPPNAPNQNAWLRTIFLRTKEIQKNQEEVQKFCIEIRDRLIASSEHFTDAKFEVGIMPDVNFWLAVNQNKFTLFDKNPPKAPPVAVAPQGARRA